MARVAAVFALLAGGLATVAALSGAAVGTVPSGNLVQNPGAEQVRSVSVGPQKPVGWSAGSGFTVTAYGAAGSPAAPAGGGANFFSGPPVDSPYNSLGAALDNSGWDAEQAVNVAGAATEIDSGNVKATFSVLMGGFQGVANASATFKDGAGADLGSIALGPASAQAMTPFTATKTVPPRTRTITVRLAEHRATQSVPGFGFFDNVSLTLSGGGPPPTTTTTPSADPIEGPWNFDGNIVVISRKGSSSFVGTVTKPAAVTCPYRSGEAIWQIAKAGGAHYTGTHVSRKRDCSIDPNYPATWDLVVAGGQTKLKLCVTARDGYKACETLSRPGTAAKDSVAPSARALPSGGRLNAYVRLRYQVSDDSGTTREEIGIYRGSARLGGIRTAFGPSLAGHTYYVRWRATTAGSLRFCVRSFDKAGNGSPTSCAALQISG